MSDPLVTIVVSQRERFSYSEHSLDNIYQNTGFPFKLVYVSAGTPESVKRYLETESQRKSFHLVHTDKYLSPNQARNLGLREVKTRYAVFMDNDVLVTPGWLETLVRCAEQTQAWIVGPLYLYGKIERQAIHMAGGMLHFEERDGKRILYDEHRLVDQPLADVRASLKPGPCDFVEFHCMLVRTDVFERVGPMDEGLLSVHEHIDICATVREAGGSVYFEPNAVISYVAPPPFAWSDLPFFMLRWSDAWNLASARHFNQKWGVSSFHYFGNKGDPRLEDAIYGESSNRRNTTGLRIKGDDADRPRSLLEQATFMTALFQSFDRDSFDLLLTTDDEFELECERDLNLQAMFDRLPTILKQAEDNNLNVVVRPLSRGRANEPKLIKVDDLDLDGFKRLRRYAFLTLETSPQKFQCWLAVANNAGHNTAILRRLLGATEAANGSDGLVPLAGSRNAGMENEAGFPRIKLFEAHTGFLNTLSQLQASEVRPCLKSACIS